MSAFRLGELLHEQQRLVGRERVDRPPGSRIASAVGAGTGTVWMPGAPVTCIRVPGATACGGS